MNTYVVQVESPEKSLTLFVQAECRYGAKMKVNDIIYEKLGDFRAYFRSSPVTMETYIKRGPRKPPPPPDWTRSL